MYTPNQIEAIFMSDQTLEAHFHRVLPQRPELVGAEELKARVAAEVAALAASIYQNQEGIAHASQNQPSATEVATG